MDENKVVLWCKLDEKWYCLLLMIFTSSVIAEGRDEVFKFVSSLIVYCCEWNEECKKVKW